MSALIRGLVSAGTPIPYSRPGVNQNDDSIQPADYRQTRPQTREGISEFSDILWTRSSFPNQPGTGDCLGLDSAHQYWEWNTPPTGCHVRKVVSGTVVDVNGNVVSGATVQLFNTATGTLVDTQTTASDGTYRVGDPNNVACFAVAYDPGSPDTAGTTVNTLTGT